MVNANSYFIPVKVMRGSAGDDCMIQINQVSHLNLNSRSVYMNNGEILTLSQESLDYLVKVIDDVFRIWEAN